MFERKSPLEKEWRQLLKREENLMKRMEKARAPFWEKKLAKMVPEKLQVTLEAAFCKGFETILSGGTGLLEKTFSKEKLEAEYKTREYAQEVYHTRKNLAAAKKAAGRQTAMSVAGASAEGAVLGILGIGLPDIPLFLGVLLRSLYTLALHYGVDYRKQEEKELLLDLIELSVYHGKDLRERNARMDRRLYEMAQRDRQSHRQDEWQDERQDERRGQQCGRERQLQGNRPEGYTREPAVIEVRDREGDSVHRAAKALSGELLYLKFLQGVPLAGVIGGVYDGIYLKKITAYASLKLERRYLVAKMEK